VEPLTDAATWKRANASLDARPGRGKGKAEAIERALLASSLFCPQCGGPMYRLACGYGASRQPYYRCAGKGAVRRSACKNLVPAAVADALAERFMAHMDAPILRTVTIPGRNHDDELAAIQFELEDLPRRALDEDAEDAERARLRSERKRLAALPDVPDQIVTEPTGETYAEHWASLGTAERGSWLRAEHVRCYAARTDRGLAEAAFDDLAVGALGAASLVQGDGVSLAVTWLGSGIDAA
jgi:hypothetical protein